MLYTLASVSGQAYALTSEEVQSDALSLAATGTILASEECK